MLESYPRASRTNHSTLDQMFRKGTQILESFFTNLLSTVSQRVFKSVVNGPMHRIHERVRFNFIFPIHVDLFPVGDEKSIMFLINQVLVSIQ